MRSFHDLDAYRAYIEDNLERMSRKTKWVPVCFDEFLMSEECDTYRSQLFPEQLNEEQQTTALAFVGDWGPQFMTDEEINGGDFVEAFGQVVQMIMEDQ